MTVIDPAEVAAHWTALGWAEFVHERRVAGRTVRYLDYGDGPPLVLLHGLGCSWQWWLENVPELGRHHRVIAVDLPGFGRSEALDAPAEMATHADVVHELADTLELGPMVVGGHSMGGLVTLAMAGARPDRVRGVVLINAGGVPMSDLRLAIVIAILRRTQRVLTHPGIVRALIHRPRARAVLLKGALHDPRTIRRELAAEVVPLMAAPGFLDAIAAAGRAVKASRPEDVVCPVLLIWGDRDPIVTVANARAMHERLADSRLELLPGVGHTPMVEAPDEFNRLLLDFTRELKDIA
jgi:pimeloyl-ACP methyl ester carboxylesterase